MTMNSEAKIEKLMEDYKDAIVNAVLVGQSNPRLGDMVDANRLVDQAHNALKALLAAGKAK